MNDEQTNGAPTRDELIVELGRVDGLLDCLAALVRSGDARAARAMAEAMRGGEVEGATRLDLGGERPKLTGWAVQHLATMLAEHLDTIGAPNHCAWTVTFPAHDGKPARELDLVAQWSNGVTTAARIARAEKGRDEALACIKDVQAEAEASEKEAKAALDELHRRVDVAEAERDRLHAAVRAVAAAQLACDAATDSHERAATGAALDNAEIALFALVPAEVTP
jgi:hypothetical protein